MNTEPLCKNCGSPLDSADHEAKCDKVLVIYP